MLDTPKGMRLQIGIFGRRNSGKSSFLNAYTRQDTSIVSDVPGTTTDPVEKAMELLPIGPVLFIDTAGLDDEGALGGLRIDKSKKAMERVDVAVIVSDAGQWGAFEDGLLNAFRESKTFTVVVFNKSDLGLPSDELKNRLDLEKVPHMTMSAKNRQGVEEFKELLVRSLPEEFLQGGVILRDLVPQGELVMLVVPIDMEAPKGRIILPQVQAIRDTLDGDSYCVVVKENRIREVLDRLKRPPALVVTDSQAFKKVSQDVPPEIPLTSFSILFARFKGDLRTFVDGARAIDSLRPGDKVLVAEACSHHPIGDDIGRVKLPAWLEKHVGGKLDITHIQGHDFPGNPADYKLIIHCGSCVMNRKEVLFRCLKCRQSGTPLTNYGVAIAHMVGILPRALAPFGGL